jgi:hypothetical protein
MADDTPQKGQAAPLEGALGRDIMMVLGIGFASMSLKMCQGLALTMGNAMSGPLSGMELSNISNSISLAATNSIAGPAVAAPIANPFLSGPKMMGPGGLM